MDPTGQRADVHHATSGGSRAGEISKLPVGTAALSLLAALSPG
jgi:hypothetical protein